MNTLIQALSERALDPITGRARTDIQTSILSAVQPTHKVQAGTEIETAMGLPNKFVVIANPAGSGKTYGAAQYAKNNIVNVLSAKMEGDAIADYLAAGLFPVRGRSDNNCLGAADYNSLVASGVSSEKAAATVAAEYGDDWQDNYLAQARHAEKRSCIFHAALSSDLTAGIAHRPLIIDESTALQMTQHVQIPMSLLADARFDLEEGDRLHSIVTHLLALMTQNNKYISHDEILSDLDIHPAELYQWAKHESEAVQQTVKFLIKIRNGELRILFSPGMRSVMKGDGLNCIRINSQLTRLIKAAPKVIVMDATPVMEMLELQLGTKNIAIVRSDSAHECTNVSAVHYRTSSDRESLLEQFDILTAHYKPDVVVCQKYESWYWEKELGAGVGHFHFGGESRGSNRFSSCRRMLMIRDYRMSIGAVREQAELLGYSLSEAAIKQIATAISAAEMQQTIQRMRPYLAPEQEFQVVILSNAESIEGTELLDPAAMAEAAQEKYFRDNLNQTILSAKEWLGENTNLTLVGIHERMREQEMTNYGYGHFAQMVKDYGYNIIELRRIVKNAIDDGVELGLEMLAISEKKYEEIASAAEKVLEIWSAECKTWELKLLDMLQLELGKTTLARATALAYSWLEPEEKEILFT